MLGYEETINLIKLAQKGDENAKTILIENNSPLVKSIVKRYKNKGVEYDDLYQLGCVGFLKAIKNFDESFNVKFSTYAVPMIAGEIKRYLRDDGSIKVSRAIKGQYYLISKFIDIYRQKFGSAPNYETIAEKFNLDVQEIMFIMESSKMPISIFEETDKDGGHILLDKIVSFDNSEQTINRIVLKDIISSLNEKDRQIIMLRYFRDKTQSEVASILNVSQVQVSRLENKILDKIKSRFTK